MTTRTRLPFRLLSPEAALPVASVPGSPVEGVPVSVLEGVPPQPASRPKQSGQFLELHCSIPSFHSVHTLGMFRACLRGMGALHYRGTMIAGRSMGFPFAKGNEMGE